MDGKGLNYFTHTVDGEVYGAWYRVVSPNAIEVIGVGLLETCDYAGFSPESTACSVLENCVRENVRLRMPIPSLGSEATVEEAGAGIESRIEACDGTESTPIRRRENPPDRETTR